LENEREVPTQEGKDLAKQLGCPFLETSAKARINVEEAFFEVVREIRKWNAHASGETDNDGKKPVNKKRRCTIL